MACPLLPLQTGLASPGTLSLLLVLAGLGLSFAEAIVPDAHFVVLGVAPLMAGLTGFLVVPLASPIILRLLVFIFGALTLYSYQELGVYNGKGEGKTSDSGALAGKMGRVTECVTSTSGEVKLDEGGFNPYYTAWSVHGEPEAGTEVIIIDLGGGNVVTVEGIGPGEGGIDRKLTHERAWRHRESVG